MQHHHGGPPPPPPPPGPHGGVYAQHPQHQQQQAPPPQKGGGIPYIGSRISLISKTDIRYEGFLFNIDTQQSMVALQHVRSFGTEGRRPDHIPPSDQVLPYATFKAAEIKDLHVCEAAPPVYGAGGAYAAPPPPPPMPHPHYQQQQQHAPQYGAQPPLPPPPPPSAPAPPRQPAPPPSPPKAKPAGPTLLTPGSMSSANMAKPPSPQRQQERQQHQHQQQQHYHQQQQQQQQQQSQYSEETTSHQAHSRGERDAGGSRTIPGMGGHLLKRKERRVPGGEGEGGATPAVSTGLDFNFESGLTTFDKEEEFQKLNVNENKAKGSYQKSSFFDTISCDALDRLEGNSNRFNAGQERKLNTETFGAVGLNNNNRRGYRGNRGGGGGGGRGGGNRRNNNGGGRGGGRGGNGNGNGGGNPWNRNGNPTQA